MEKRDATDLTDAQWELMKPQVPAGRGRPPSVDRREVVNAILSLLRTGCQWRMLPQGLPYWSTVHSCFWRWKRNGVLDRPHAALLAAERTRLGRDPSPSRGGDRQPKREDHEKRGSRGDDANKKVSGRHRHVLVDAPGLLLEVLVQPASVQKRAGGETLLARDKARPSCGRLSKVWADGGFDGTPFRDWTRENCGWNLEVVAR